MEKAKKRKKVLCVVCLCFSRKTKQHLPKPALVELIEPLSSMRLYISSSTVDCLCIQRIQQGERTVIQILYKYSRALTWTRTRPSEVPSTAAAPTSLRRRPCHRPTSRMAKKAALVSVGAPRRHRSTSTNLSGVYTLRTVHGSSIKGPNRGFFCFEGSGRAASISTSLFSRQTRPEMQSECAIL